MTRKRRGPHEGSVYQRKSDGLWCASLSLGLDANKKRVRKLVTARTKTKVIERLREIQVKHLGASSIEPTVRLVKHVADDWLDRVKRTLSPSTWRSYELNMRLHVLPHVGHLRMSEVNPGHVRLMIAALEKMNPTHTRTHSQAHHALSRLFEVAIELGLVTSNPVRRVPRPRHEPRELQVWTLDQSIHFLTRAKDEPRFAAFALALVNGLRAGEIRGLKWQDIDFGRGLISIQRQHGRDGERAPKTKRSRRQIPLMPTAAEALQAHRLRLEEARERNRVKRGIDRDEWPFVFATSASGKPVNVGNLHAEWKRALELAELPDIRMHDLRHTTATLLLGLGVDAKAIADILGHASVRITLDVYAHLTPALASNAAAKLDAALRPSSQPAVSHSVGRDRHPRALMSRNRRELGRDRSPRA